MHQLYLSSRTIKGLFIWSPNSSSESYLDWIMLSASSSYTLKKNILDLINYICCRWIDFLFHQYECICFSKSIKTLTIFPLCNFILHDYPIDYAYQVVGEQAKYQPNTIWSWNNQILSKCMYGLNFIHIELSCKGRNSLLPRTDSHLHRISSNSFVTLQNIPL